MDCDTELPPEDAPILVERYGGLGWLARAPREMSLRIGATGGTKSEAEMNFRKALAAWRLNLARGGL